MDHNGIAMDWLLVASTAASAIGTLLLAGAAFRQMKLLDQHRLEDARFDISMKDMTLNQQGQLAVWGVANLGRHPIVLKYISTHDAEGRRIGHAFSPLIPIESGGVLASATIRLIFGDSRQDIYDGLDPRDVTLPSALEQAKFVRLIFQAGGNAEVDHHVVLPMYRFRRESDPVFSQVRRSIFALPRATPRGLRHHHFRAIDVSDPRVTA